MTYTLAKVVVHVQDSSGNPLQSYLVRIYNLGGSQWGYKWTDSNGDATFYLIEGNYQYQVEKNGYNSGKLPVGGFTVSAPSPAPGGTANDQGFTHIVGP